MTDWNFLEQKKQEDDAELVWALFEELQEEVEKLKKKLTIIRLFVNISVITSGLCAGTLITLIIRWAMGNV